MSAAPLPEATLLAAIEAVEEALRKGYKPPGVALRRGEFGAIRTAAGHLQSHRISFNYVISQAQERIRPVDWSLYAAKEPERREIPENDAHLRAAAREGRAGFAPVMPGFEVKSVASRAEGGEWVKQTRAPGEEFEVPDGHRVKGVSALVDPDGRTVQQWVKTSEGAPEIAAIEAVRAAFADFEPLAPAVARPKDKRGDLLTVYPIADHHLGLAAWGRETGDDYDLKIATKLLRETMAELVARSPESEVGVVLNLGDFLHADNSSNRTEKSGNPLDVDTRYAKVLNVGSQLLAESVIQALSKHDRVVLRNLPGNHDPYSALALTMALKAYFRNEKRVKVDDDPGRFWFFQHGQVMLCATHGDMAKPDQMPGIAAAIRPDIWGATQFRYGYGGHVHHKSKRVSEVAGMIFETFQTLAAKDAWHAGEGYVSGRSMTAVTHHCDSGEHMRHTISVPRSP